MLKTDRHLQIGEHHLNHCEDYLLIAEIGDNILLIAVCDGCTMGEESWFASALIGKLLKKISREIHFRTLREPQLTEDLCALEKLILDK
ncbi:MAG: serine/threonine protein phosphatase PrpC [Saprospiraceae bacterium]|jgi:serine/threonine protein phosphatase PrpC